jgi:hypothetical protein
MDLQALSIKLATHDQEGNTFESIFITDDVLQIIIDSNEELPIYVTATEEQMLCITYLFDKSELKSGVANELNETLLKLNVPVPLSAFAIIEDKYAIYGSLSVNSSFDDIAHELVNLADNAIEALETLQEYFA